MVQRIASKTRGSRKVSKLQRDQHYYRHHALTDQPEQQRTTELVAAPGDSRLTIDSGKSLSDRGQSTSRGSSFKVVSSKRRILRRVTSMPGKISTILKKLPQQGAECKAMRISANKDTAAVACTIRKDRKPTNPLSQGKLGLFVELKQQQGAHDEWQALSMDLVAH